MGIGQSSSQAGNTASQSEPVTATTHAGCPAPHVQYLIVTRPLFEAPLHLLPKWSCCMGLHICHSSSALSAKLLP